MSSFIEEYRVAHGVEPICRVLPIAPSTFYAHATIARDPDLASDRAKQDAIDRKKIKDAFAGSGKRHGAKASSWLSGKTSEFTVEVRDQDGAAVLHRRLEGQPQ